MYVHIHNPTGLVFSLEHSTYSVVEDNGRVRVGVVRREGAWGYNLTLNVVPVSGITNMTTSEFIHVRTYSTHILKYILDACVLEYVKTQHENYKTFPCL